MAFIEVKNLTFTYPNSQKPVLENVSFEIEQGEVCVICGASGSGKSTLARHLVQSLIPHGKREGNIKIDGCNIFEPNECLPVVGFLGQDIDGQIVTDSVLSELKFAPQNLGLDKQEQEKRLSEAVALFSLEDILFSKTDALSDGQKQRLNLASIFTLSPSVLVLDEPFSRLDFKTAFYLISLLESMAKSMQLTVVICEHNASNLISICDRLILIEDGRTVAANTSIKALSRDGTLSPEHFVEAISSPLTRAFKAVKSLDAIPLSVKEASSILAKTSKPRHLSSNISSKSQSKIKPNKSDIVLCANDIFFRYSRHENDVLTGVDFQLLKGEVHCLFGTNGSGKSTLLKILSCLKKPYSGSVRAFDKLISSYKNSSLYDGVLSILLSNVDAYLLHDSVLDELNSMKKDPLKTDELIKKLQLASILSNHPLDLSFGQKQAVALAKVLLTSPKILLLDEPTKGLDQSGREQLKSILLDLKSKGTAIAIATHDLDFAADIADSCSIMFNGKVIASQSAESFFNSNNYYTTECSLLARNFDSTVYNEEGLKELLLSFNK